MSVILEAANITATVLASGIVETYKLGGNPSLALLAMLGLFAILASVFKDTTKVLSVLFIVVVATPILLLEQWRKKRKARYKDTAKI